MSDGACVPVADEEEFNFYYDAAYDQGFTDGLAGTPPCEHCGDLRVPYYQGYADGAAFWGGRT